MFFKYGSQIIPYNETATSGGTLTLVSTSRMWQVFTGTQAHTCVLPDARTLELNQPYKIQNRSTGKITIKDGSGAIVLVLGLNQDVFLNLFDNSIQAGSWLYSVTSTTVGGTGGSSSIKWTEGGNAPVFSQADPPGVGMYQFSAGNGNKLFAVISVPSSYISGSQISLTLPIYSDDTTGTLLMQTISTLNRTGVDGVTSISNQRTSTNAAMSLTSSTAGKFQQVSFDLTDMSGKINGVDVSPGNYIFVTLTRGADTSTADASVMTDGSIPYFQ